MGPSLCRVLALAVLGAGCAKAHVETTSPASAGQPAATARPQGDAAGPGDGLDWATVTPVAAPSRACVRYPATGNYHVCLAADAFGCIHFGDYCEPATGTAASPK